MPPYIRINVKKTLMRSIMRNSRFNESPRQEILESCLKGGKSVVKELADFIAKTEHNVRGFYA